jgi:hypothetical protein
MISYGSDIAYSKLNQADEQSEGNGVVSDFLTDAEIVTKYKKIFADAINKSSGWRTKQEQWHRQRMRIKKKKVFPFPDCSNLKMPTDERFIRRKKAKLSNRIFGVRPIVQVIPPPSGNPERCSKIEKFLDHLIIDVMKFYPKALIAIDKMLESGFNIMKPYWRIEVSHRDETFDLHDLSIQEALFVFDRTTDPDMLKQELIKRYQVDMSPLVAEKNEKELEKCIIQILSGDPTVEMHFDDIVYNAPDVAVLDCTKVVVPSNSPLDPNECESLFFDLEISHREFKSRAGHGYKQDALDDVDLAINQVANNPDLLKDTLKDYREGIDRLAHTGMIRLWEIHTWEKLYETDEYPRKCVITLAPDYNKVLRRIQANSLSGKTPAARIDYEIIDDRWYSSRGIPEINTDQTKEIDVQKNQRIDSQTQRNMPFYLYRVGVVNPNLKLKPGKGIPVPAGVPFSEVFQMVNNTNLNAEFSNKDEIQQLNAEMEELHGEINFTLQSQINKRQPRTGVEVEAQVQGQVPQATLEGEIVSAGFSKLFQMIFDLWCQHGEDEYEFQYFGADMNGQFETIKLRKEELQGNLVVVRGNDSNTNPNIRMQKANQIGQVIADPLALQMGLTTPLNVYNAKKEQLRQLGVNPDMYVTQPQPPRPMPPPPLPVKVGMEDLTPMEKAQVVQRMGVQPDYQGHLEQDSANMDRVITETAKIKHSAMRENISERT